MTLLDFDAITPAAKPKPNTKDTKPTFVSMDKNVTTWVAKPDGAWTWEDLRDYVIFEIESRRGQQPRDLIKEKAIFRSFFNRQPRAVEIARHAFGFCDGLWRGQPITTSRFCKGSDPYFAEPILEALG